MNDLVKQDLHQLIASKLLAGENPDMIQKEFNCPLYVIHKIMGGNDFLEQASSFLEKSLKLQALTALKNISHIAGDDSISAATRLKANQWIAEKALEFNELGHNDDAPETMTQNQLARRLKELQSEAVKRARPIDAGVIDHDLDGMLG